MNWLMNLFSPFTLNPAIAAAGVALIAAPIIIHLINRVRYRRVQFAAMEFLLASQQKNRRRVLLEQLLLLLLRVLIVIAMVALIARLVLDPSALALIRSGAKTHHIVLLDDSGSMLSRQGDGTAFEDAKKVIRRLASEMASGTGSHQLTLLLLSKAGENEAFLTERDVDESLLNELDTKLENVQCTRQALDLGDGITAARQRLLPERIGGRILHVLSDFRRVDWIDQPNLLTEVSSLDDAGIAVNLVRLVADEAPNLAVTSLLGDLNATAVGIPLRVKVGVTNLGQTPAENVSIGVAQGKQKLPRAERIAKIEPNQEVFTEFDVAFETPGLHSLRFELESDAFPTDDVRYAITKVEPSHSVLIIDGTPGKGDGPGLLADALSPIPGLSGLSPRIEQVDFIRRSPLGDFSAVILVNVPNLPADAVRALEQYVRRGGGLMWFVGDAVESEFYSSQLYQQNAEEAEDNTGEKGSSRLSTGLFPIPLATSRTSLESQAESGFPEVVFEPIGRFASFSGELGKYWRDVRISSFLAPRDEWERNDDVRADGVTTVAALRGGDPFLLRHVVGEGTVLTVLTSAGQEWTNLPRQFVFVPFLLESVKEMMIESGEASSRPVGSSLTFALPAAEYDPEVRVEKPNATSVSIRLTPKSQTEPESSAEKALTLSGTFSDTDEPGVYKTFTAPVSGGTLEESWFAMNAPRSESQLQLAEPVRMRRALANTENVVIREPDNLSWLNVREAGREIRLALILFLIALLVGEQALAYRLSYHPKTRSRAF